MPVSPEDLKAAHARIGRLEGRVDALHSEMGKCASGIAWIKGYLQTRPEPGVPKFRRDAGMVAGGGGIVGVVLYVLEQIVQAMSNGAPP